MDAAGWRESIGEMVREHMKSPPVAHYYSVKMNKPRAEVMLTELAHFIRHRRDCWAYVSGNCPELSVKQKILHHEYAEIIKDQYSEHGHLELIIRQGKAIGLSSEDILNAEPIPTTRMALYAWAWMTREKNWIAGISALTVTEWVNDDRLLADQGGGNSTRMAKRWTEDMGIKIKDMPNFSTHAEADEEHSDMFLPILSKFATEEKEKMALCAVKESLDLLTIYRSGVSEAMEKIPS